MNCLSLENISLKLNQDFSLSDISLSVSSGQVHAIVGANGSGKSSLMRVISGEFTDFEGNIIYNGKTVNNYFLKESVYFSSQNILLFENMSVAENIYFNNFKNFRKAPIGSINHTKIYSECKKIFKEFGIDINIYYHTKHLAHAHKQMICLIEAYVSNYPIIIFDEPTSILSNTERDIVEKILNKLVEQGKIIFYITHRLDEINRFADYVSVIKKGSLIFTSEVKNLDENDIISKIFGKKIDNKYPRINIPFGNEVLRVENLYYKDILNNINFTLRKGEILGITGQMGAGKSVLANCLFGALRYDRGSVFLNGELINFKDSLEAVTAGIALIPENTQENAIFETLDLIKNTSTSSLKRFEENLILNNSQILETFKQYKKSFNILPGNPTDKMDIYSGGNKQKVVIARWLMSHRKIFILNQPTRGIDVSSKVDIYNSISNMRSDGVSIIFISSDVDELIGMCDRILVLASNSIVCDLPVKEATNEIILKYQLS